jgi:hypothetical protein
MNGNQFYRLVSRFFRFTVRFFLFIGFLNFSKFEFLNSNLQFWVKWSIWTVFESMVGRY